MRKIFTVFLIGLSVFSAVAAAAIEPIANCAAFQRYQARPKNELSKLIYLLERYNLPGVEIKIDGNIFQAQKAFPFGKIYLAMNYHKENAGDWIRKYCYRSPFTNKVMLIRLPGDEFGPARDFLLSALVELEEAEKMHAAPSNCEVPPRKATENIGAKPLLTPAAAATVPANS